MADKSKNEPVTKNDLIEAKKEIMDDLTIKLKEETAKLSTKASLEVVANEVLKNSADIEKLKEDMGQVRSDVSILKYEMGEVKETLTSLEDKFGIMINAVDNMNSKFDIWLSEKAAIDHALIRHDDKLDDHEARIKRLELRRV